MSKIVITETKFDKLFLVKRNRFLDARGALEKFFEQDVHEFKSLDLCDIYTTNSKKNVVRGLHHQIEPFGQHKIVSCISGAFWDVALDLRPTSNTYGQVFKYLLTPSNETSILVPPGFSHGTYSLIDDTVMLSMCSGKYLPEYESGFLMSSLNLDFYDSRLAVVSEKDRKLKEFTIEKEL